MKTRKLLAVVLAVAMLASFVSIPVFAEGEGAACETLGILVGTGDGVTDDYLATTATRAQAALIYLRLLGLEEEALAFDGTETFTDAADATEFWQPILEYLKANPQLGWVGYEDGSFKPNDPVTGQAFTKLLLVALGYEEGVDFTWDTVMAFAETVGLTALAEKADADLTVEDLAVALVEALGTKTTAPTDVTLLTQLVIDGVIDEADAVAAGFEVGEEALVIVDAYASAVDEVTIEMSIDVPEGAVITLKKGTASYAVSEAVDGNVITLTALFNLPAGTYTATVDGSSAEFEVVAQHAVDLMIGADSLYPEDDQDLEVSLLDQYGDKMSLAGTNYSIFNQADGWVFNPAVSTTFVIDLECYAEAGDSIYVFVYDPGSMLSVSGEIPVIATPVVTSLAVGGVTLGDANAAMLFAGSDDNILDVTVYDQYGQEMALDNSMFDTHIPSLYDAEIQVLSSNGSVIDADSWDIIGGEFTFDAGAPGMSLFTFIIPAQAFIATSEMITVYANPTLTTVETAGPDEALYAGEATDFAIVGFDQYGNVIDVPSGPTPVTFTATVDLFGTEPNVEATNEIGFTPDLDGTSTVYYFLNGIFQGTFDVTVNPEAYPFQITGVDTYAAMEEGTDTDIMSGDITVIDQYGRTMDNPFTGCWDYIIMTASATDLFFDSFNGPGSGFNVYAETGEDTGSATFVAKLTNCWQVMTESAYTFDITNVKSEDVDGFAMTPFEGTMYTGSDWTLGQATDGSDYWKYVDITGTYGGVAVLLNLDPDGVPTLIDVITSTEDNVEVMSGSILVPTSPADGSTTIQAWQNGVSVASADLALDSTDPDCVTVTNVADGTGTAWNDRFVCTDQYGVALDYDLLQASRPGLDPDWYFDQSSWSDADYDYYAIVKWDGSISATYKEAN